MQLQPVLQISRLISRVQAPRDESPQFVYQHVSDRRESTPRPCSDRSGQGTAADHCPYFVSTASQALLSLLRLACRQERYLRDPDPGFTERHNFRTSGRQLACSCGVPWNAWAQVGSDIASATASTVAFQCLIVNPALRRAARRVLRTRKIGNGNVPARNRSGR